MLGKLFNLGAGSGTGPLPSAQPLPPRPFPLESVQEDIHTRHLLFPDPQDLYEHRINQLYPLSSGASTPTGSSTNAFDYNADIELDVRDVRIIIMQDALSSVAASLLYDSQPAPSVPTASMDRPSATAGSYSVQEPRRNPASPRKPSVSYAQRPVVIQPGSPKIRQGAFDRRPSVHSRGQGHVESESQRAWREYREELATFSSCIFGNSELMAHKGTSTKVHVVPSSDVRPAESASVFGDGRGSLGRSTMRASRLSQSFSSSENPSPFPPPAPPGGPIRTQDRKKVLITRLFPVSLSLDDDNTPSLHAIFSEDMTAYPFPQSSEEVRARKKKVQPRQKRTPMYAVALIITLPSSAAHPTPAAVRSSFRGPSSYAEQDAFPASFSSARRSGWTLVQGGLGAPDSYETSYGTDMEDQIDAITHHWDIIMRTLSHLQTLVSGTLLNMLRQADLSSPDPLPLQMARASSASGKRSEDGQPLKTPKTNAKHITLLPNCLLENRSISSEVEAAKTRIVAGIRASRVTTGQNRWPIWREEARWVAKWAGAKEQGFFFFNLLTGFLATHTDWLQALSPPGYRRRHLLQQQQKGRSEEDTLVPSRTIILSDNKIAARRLVFLLSAFLPASQQLTGIRAHRPSTPASFGTLSQSPPSFVVPILKEESLRRKLNRRTGSRMPSHSRNMSLQTHNGRPGAIPPPLAHLSMEAKHERRASDAASIRTTHLPIRGSDPTARKSGTATTATVTPETSIPHFSTVHRAELFAQGRPGSSNSAAADDLKRLTRDDSPGSQGSTGGERRQSSRWSVISGLWNGRRRDSTGKAPAPNEGQNAGPGSPTKSRQPSIAGPSNAAPDAGCPTCAPAAVAGEDVAAGPRDPTPPPRAPADALGLSERVGAAQKTQRTPDPSGAFESPVKTSININDGVIDVDVPLPDFITSFESAVSSPSSSGYLSASGFGTGLDAFEQSFRFAADGDIPLNVAGWLQCYHPDFVLQALPVQQPDILEQIKKSMRAEPTPIPPPATASSSSSAEGTTPTEKWIDISSALVADTTTFTVTRIRYRRLFRLIRNTTPAPPAAATTTTPSTPAAAATTPPPPSHETQLKEEEFIQEPLVVFDDALIEAVERVIAAAGTSTETTVSKANSSSSSRSTSKRRDRDRDRDRDGRDSLSAVVAAAAAAAAAGVGSLADARPDNNNNHGQAHHYHHHHQGQGQALVPVVVPAAQEVPRSKCKTVLLSALEDIIQDVIMEREGGREAKREREKDSPLRGAVRAWIESLDLVGDS